MVTIFAVLPLLLTVPAWAEDLPPTLRPPARPAADTVVPATVPDTTGAPGASLTVPVVLDLTATGMALGAYQGRLVFDPAILALDQSGPGDFDGLTQVNADSAEAGVVRFAGASSDPAVNLGATSILELTFTVLGAGGAVSPLALTVGEVAAAADGLPDLTHLLDVRGGSVTADPGPVRLSLRPDTAVVDSGGATVVRIWMDRSATVASPEALEARLQFDPSVLRVDSVRPGTFGGELSANLAHQADSGAVRWAVAAGSLPPGDSLTVALVHVRAVGTRGASTAIGLAVDALVNGQNLASLLRFVDVGAAPEVRVRAAGIWGDTDFTWRDSPASAPVSAFDALICLSHVVARDTSGYDVGACDVAPDLDTDDDGLPDTYDGRVTALDALVILSHVVGKDTGAFRVGGTR